MGKSRIVRLNVLRQAVGGDGQRRVARGLLQCINCSGENEEDHSEEHILKTEFEKHHLKSLGYISLVLKELST